MKRTKFSSYETGSSETPQGVVANNIGQLTELMEARRIKRAEAKAALEKESYGKAANYKKDVELENLKSQHQKELAEVKARLTQKHGAKKKFKAPDMLEQFMLTKGHFPAAMKVKKTAKGTDNPFAEYTPDDEMKHIAALAQMRGFVPDQVTETAPSHEGGIMGIGAKDVPGRVIQTYKPGPNAGGSIDIPEPQPQDETQE